MGLFKYLRRRKLRRQPFPVEWENFLLDRVPFYAKLREPLKSRFLDDVKIFVAEKYFEGVQGQPITDEVKVVIAASAARLVLFRDISYFDRLTEIVVYPDDYKHAGDDGRILGEAHAWGVVVLSWRAVVQGLANPLDGHDTATHEFAHVLDRGSGDFNGTPTLDRMKQYQPWGEVMSDHFARLRKGGSALRQVMRDYGATNEAEFFAVATESFFEKAQQMQSETPELYAMMQSYYGGDPAAHVLGEQGDDDKWDQVGRNDPCPCGSGKKFKRCCGRDC